jgi:hypothetical protein
MLTKISLKRDFFFSFLPLIFIFQIVEMYRGGDDHAVKRSVTELLNPSGYVRRGVKVV